MNLYTKLTFITKSIIQDIFTNLRSIVGLMLGHIFQRFPNNNPAMLHCSVFSVNWYISSPKTICHDNVQIDYTIFRSMTFIYSNSHTK